LAAAVAFHIEHVLTGNRIIDWLKSQWVTFLRRPSLIVRSLKVTPGSLEDLRMILRDERALLDDRHRTKNSWDAIFISGLREMPTARWIFQRLSRPGRPHDGPLFGNVAS
jgi:hypothetical protein